METPIVVRGYHCDMYQHVNNARYLEFLEEARWQTFEKHIDLEALMARGFLFFVVNINISYRSQARVNDKIIVHTTLHKVGHTSGVIRQKIKNTNTGAICVKADVTFVITNHEGKPQKIEGELLHTLKQLPFTKG